MKEEQRKGVWILEFLFDFSIEIPHAENGGYNTLLGKQWRLGSELNKRMAEKKKLCRAFWHLHCRLFNMIKVIPIFVLLWMDLCIEFLFYLFYCYRAYEIDSYFCIILLDWFSIFGLCMQWWMPTLYHFRKGTLFFIFICFIFIVCIMFVNGYIFICKNSIGTDIRIVITFCIRKDRQIKFLSRLKKISNEIPCVVTCLTAIYELYIIVHALFIF